MVAAMKNYTITVVFKVAANPANITEMESIVSLVYSPSLREHGCKEYRWYRSESDAGDYLLFMIWASKGDFEAHVRSPHVQEAERRLAPILRSPAPELIWEYIPE
jgi:quinol monooxygenase YgiN